MSGLFRSVDCIRIPVADLDAALAFYRDALGHALIWRTETAVGLAMAESGSELVLHTGGDSGANLLVDSVDDAVRDIVGGGGAIIVPPFDIQIGRCAVLRDPWGNALQILDMTKGRLTTDAEGNVTGVDPAAGA